MTATLANVEDLKEFDVRWRWIDGGLEPGFTAVLRVKNEARNLPFVLPPLFRSMARVLLVDNGSTDGTPEIARELALAEDFADSLEVLRYPFEVARCGGEHLATSPQSVRSLVYFYNWAFSNVRTTYAVKWDGDMVLSCEGEQVFRELEWQLEGQQVRVRMMTIPFYIESESHGYADLLIRHFETYAWPNAEHYAYSKFLEWELLQFPPNTPTKTLPDGVCLEIKRLDIDEFSNWSALEFDENPRLLRKRHERKIFRQLHARERVDGLVAFTSDRHDHVIEVARRTSVPQWEGIRAEANRHTATKPDHAA